ncbi:hypothetical protein [Flagellimonas sp.]|uniref:hypothetical protein n=1 Tax=Flagellimonas sp. TaxID=2058762 RepID=UPI003BACC0EA
MTKEERIAMTNVSWELHNQIETAYMQHPAQKTDEAWLEKQRLLLADMALHLLQTSINPEEVKLDRLRDNLHAILTISDQFLPEVGLKKMTDNLYSDTKT